MEEEKREIRLRIGKNKITINEKEEMERKDMKGNTNLRKKGK